MSETETSWDQPSRSDCPLHRSDQHSWDPNHLQSTGALGEEPAAGLESPGVGSSTPRRAAHPAAHIWLLCPLGHRLQAALAGDRQTDRQADSQDCVSYARRCGRCAAQARQGEKLGREAASLAPTP